MELKARTVLRLLGLLAFLLAGLSIADMFRSRPYDGVVLEADAPGRLIVRTVVPAGGAARAGIRAGEQIIGIDRNVLRTSGEAAALLNRHQIGATIPYLVRGKDGLREVPVRLGPRRIGSVHYLYACLLGFAFFFVGLFVLERQPRRRPAQVFFILSTLFLIFLVCRLRPASYSQVDAFILSTGMAAFLFLPASFLHFFLIFPRPVRFRPEPGDGGYLGKRAVWLTTLGTIYLLPLVVLASTWVIARRQGAEVDLISGAPIQNWWLLAAYMALALATLAYKSRRLSNPRERRGAAIVLFGSLFGLVPFLVSAVAFPSYLHTEKPLYGVGPLILVPLTFAYAIVRFQLLEIRVILRKSLLYTLTTIVVTALYAIGIAVFNAMTRGTSLAASPFFPIVFALVIVLLFEPLRKWLQTVVNRRFFAERQRLEQALEEMGDALTAQVDLPAVVHDLVANLPQLLGLHFAALYLVRNDCLERVAGPPALPERLPLLPEMHDTMARRRGLTVLDELEPMAADSEELGQLIDKLSAAGAQVIGDLTTPRRRIGLVALSGKVDQTMPLDPSELALLRRLLDQAAVALETSMLFEERTEQAELERELEIAASVQARLLPANLDFGPGWNVAAVCRPARHIGGDFFTELPGPSNGSRAVVYGDVAGKSVSGALVMMAAHEVLHSLALTHRDPEQLLNLANRRLYGLGSRKSFVALAYLTSSPNGDGLLYSLAGQPQPLMRKHTGEVWELELPPNRIPLGALDNGSYFLTHAPMECGDLVVGYSDGVIDARSPTGESFGIERLCGVVAESDSSPSVAVERILASLDEFTQGTEPYDDVTLVAVECDREAVP